VTDSQIAHADALLAAGATDPGVQRDVNEDRFFVDAARGLFIVIDGIGGQAAGARAPDVALATLRSRLERETGTPAERVREAIALANNEIHRLARTRAEWHGMACVLTVAVVRPDMTGSRVTVGHVGDTRLYRIGRESIEKVTRDHSPVGEREDAREISEQEAMRHPRRNEVYRDVGSEVHDPADPDFVDVYEFPLGRDEALLLCSDGLTDLIDSGVIARMTRRFAGQPERIVKALVAAANEAGGKDNVTAVFVEGPGFHAHRPAPVRTGSRRHGARLAVAVVAVAALVVALLAYGWVQRGMPLPTRLVDALRRPVVASAVQVVAAGQSIGAALERAQPGTTVVVEPGEYREQITLRNDVTLTSRVPRGATLRLPPSAPAAETGAAVVAANVNGATLSGFRIVGDAATPLGVGILVSDSTVAIVDVEITGATRAGVLFMAGSGSSLVGGDVHDNPGSGLIVGADTSPRVVHTAFSRNGTADPSAVPLLIEAGAGPTFQGNVFDAGHTTLIAAMDESMRATLLRHNWLMPRPEPPARRRPASAASVR